MSVTTAGHAAGPRSARAARTLLSLLTIAALVVLLALTSFSARTAAATPKHRHHASTAAQRAHLVRAAASRMRAVIVVGPVGGSTPTYIKKANAIARAAAVQGMEVVKIYPPDATWDRVVTEATGANLFVYLGHGNGWPSPHGPFQEDTKDGLGLSPAPGTTNLSLTKYYGANLVRESIRLADNAVVILNKLCYAEGNAQPGMPIPSVDVARQRVDNFAAGFLAVGARVVFGLGWQPGENIVNALFQPTPTTMDEIFMTRFGSNPDGSYKPYFGWIGWKPALYFDSVRTPGAQNHLDPDKTEGFLRAVTGDLEMSNEEFLGGVDLTDREPPVLSGLAADDVPNTLPLAETSLPMFTPNGDGLSDTLTFLWTVSEGAFVTLEVKRPNGTIVRRITRWSPAGAGAATWDGRTTTGKMARDGKYEITVTPRDRAGNEGDTDRMMIKVLTALRAPAVEPPIFWPTDADALAQTMTFSATLREPATLRWRIINKGGETVRTGIEESGQPAGPVTWTWDGLNDAGEAARDGTYTSVVTDTTDAGTYSHTQPVRLSPFQLKAKVSVAAGQRQTIVIFATEPVQGVPTITVKQKGMAAYTLTPVRVSATKFTAAWTARRGRAGTVRLTVASTDTGGGTQEKVYPLTLR